MFKEDRSTTKYKTLLTAVLLVRGEGGREVQRLRGERVAGGQAHGSR
jgi:hypothetical protein